MGGYHGKRPQAKLKVMAKLGENLYRTTKMFRFLETLPKGKWQNFLGRNRAQQQAWRTWYNSPQSQRWRDLERPKAPAAAAEGGSDQ